MTQSERKARILLAVGSWAMLVAIILGYVSEIPAVDAAIGNPSPGTAANIILSIVLVLVGVAGLACWAGALWHASVNSRVRSQTGRTVLVALLVLTSFVGAFFYFFAYVLWLHPRPPAQAA